MPTRILSVQGRRVDFRTSTNADWLDGLLVYAAGLGGVVAGPENVGNGTLTGTGVDPTAALGPHLVTVTSVQAGLAVFTLTTPDGTVAGRGVSGLPADGAGLAFTLTQGSTPFAPGDTFAISVLSAPVDITGIRFDLHLRADATRATVALAASSAPPAGTVPTIVTGGAGGQVALRVLRETMSRLAPGDYVYDLVASADGVTVAAFFGTVTHALRRDPPVSVRV